MVPRYNAYGLTVAIAFSAVLWSSPGLARPANLSLGEQPQTKSAPYTPPPDAGTPMPTGGTGSRGGCVAIPDSPPLAALVGQPHLMLTTSDRPVFWIYVPYKVENAPSGFISLQQGEDAIYEGTFSLDSADSAIPGAIPGIVGIQLPESAPSLVAGIEYDWFIDINCVAAAGDSQGAEDTRESLDGLVQRVEVSEALANELNQATTGVEVVAAYGRHHIWFDWLTELARLRVAAEPNTESTTTESDGAELDGAELNGAELNGAELNGAVLDSAELDSAELKTIWTTVLSDQQTVWLDVWAAEPLVGEIVPMMVQSDRLVP